MPAPPFTITTTDIPNGVRVAIAGEADGATFDQLDAAMNAVAAKSPAVAAFDFSKLAFISSAAMGAFVRLRSVLAKKNGGVVRIGGATPEILEAFQRARLDKILQFVDKV